MASFYKTKRKKRRKEKEKKKKKKRKKEKKNTLVKQKRKEKINIIVMLSLLPSCPVLVRKSGSKHQAKRNAATPNVSELVWIGSSDFGHLW
jgi:hypothetical protein